VVVEGPWNLDDVSALIVLLGQGLQRVSLVVFLKDGLSVLVAA